MAFGDPDASSPGVVTGSAFTLTTASFTPPSGSVLYIFIGLNTTTTGGQNNFLASVTDNRVSHLTYTRQAEFGTESGDDVLVYLYTAIVTSSVAMTVSAAQHIGGASNLGFVRVMVVTSADTTSTAAPVGAIGGGRGRTTNLSGAAAQYTSTRNGSRGWVMYGDWSQSGVPVVPAGEAVDASYDPAGQDTYASIDSTAVTTSSGTVVTLTTTTPSSALQLSWIYFEMMPAVVIATPVPVGPGLSRGFAFLDRGEYRAATPEYAFMIGIFATHIYADQFGQQRLLIQATKRASLF